MMIFGVSMLPVVQFLAAGMISHAIERKIERSGHGGRVIYVRIASTIVYVAIGLYHFWDGVHLLGRVFGIRVHM